MSGPSPRRAGRAVPAPPAAGGIDAQILATWRALLANPDPDPVQALDAIDRLLDQRAGVDAGQTAPASPLNRPSPAGTSAPHTVTAEVLAALLYGCRQADGGPGSMATWSSLTRRSGGW